MVVSYSLLITTSGTLQNDESWIKTVNLTGDVYVPDGVTLTFEDGVIVNLNGHKIIKNWAGSIVFNGNMTINPDIRLMRSGEIMGFYSSTQQALGDAHSTDEIDLASNISWLQNMTITSDIRVMSGGTLNIAGGKIINFASNRKLIINGRLTTLSSVGNEVIFTSSISSPGSWAGIWMEGGQFSGHFEHNIVQYATYGLKFHRVPGEQFKTVPFNIITGGSIFIIRGSPILRIISSKITHRRGSHLIMVRLISIITPLFKTRVPMPFNFKIQVPISMAI